MSEYASTSVGNAGLATGIIGTALGILNGGAGLLNLGNLTGNSTTQPEYVTKDQLDMSMQIAERDSQIALLQSEANANTKIIDTYKEVMSKINSNKAEQDAVNAAQAVYNASNTSAVAVLNNEVATLMSLTKTVVPATNVCPQPMSLYNSWTAPTTTTTTT